MSENTAPEPANRSLRRGILVGLASGLAAITCCVSPVVLVLLGVATAAEALTLGDTLYYTYGWYFRAAGLAIAVLAVILFLRGRGVCNVRGGISIPPDANRPGGVGRGHVRRPVLVHQVPRHLVRLKGRTPSKAASSSASRE